MNKKNIVLTLLMAVICTLAVITVVRYLPMPGISGIKKAPSKEASAVIAKINSQQSELITEIDSVEKFMEIVSQDKPMVLKFHAPWCGACKMAKKMYPEIAEHHKDKVLFYSVDVTQPGIMDKVQEHNLSKTGVRAIPTFIFRDTKNNVLEENVGLMAPDEMKEHITKTFNLK
jgi:thioredoxin 1